MGAIKVMAETIKVDQRNHARTNTSSVVAPDGAAVLASEQRAAAARKLRDLIRLTPIRTEIDDMSTQTILIIVILLLVFGGGGYYWRRGRG